MIFNKGYLKELRKLVLKNSLKKYMVFMQNIITRLDNHKPYFVVKLLSHLAVGIPVVIRYKKTVNSDRCPMALHQTEKRAENNITFLLKEVSNAVIQHFASSIDCAKVTINFISILLKTSCNDYVNTKLDKYLVATLKSLIVCLKIPIFVHFC